MNNQTRNHLSLQKHIADQDHIIRVRNAEIAALRKRAEKAEQERDEARRHECSDLDAHWRLDETLASLKEANATVASLRAAQPRPLTADDITHEMVKRAQREEERQRGDWTAPAAMRRILTAALTEPTRPEGAEELARLIATADVGEWDCGDLADALLATGRVRVVTEEQP